MAFSAAKKSDFGASRIVSATALGLTRQDLASYAGATYETVFRVMNEIIKENRIVVSGKKIKIFDKPKLLELTESV